MMQGRVLCPTARSDLVRELKLSLIILFFIGISLLFSGPIKAQEDYVIGPEDVLEIIIWGHNDLKRVQPVSLEGFITFPLIGQVRSTGKTTQQLEKEITRGLGAGYIVNPQISVTVKEYKSKKVFVMGEVRNPGIYPVSKENNLLYILSQAGGPTKDAGEEVVIIRPDNPRFHGITLEEAKLKKEKIIKVNLTDALAGDREGNIIICHGDSVVVPRMPYFFVMGEVKKPGRYNLERGTTVLMAISIGGGLTPKSAPKRTRIIREHDGEKIEFRVMMKTLVQPGDTIIVPESFF